jgi:hypothetical protein
VNLARVEIIEKNSIVYKKIKMIKKKRGQMQIQFNWIYIAIVGAIILAVFTNIAIGVKNQAENQLANDALNYFDEIFTSVQASENTENSITLPGLELEIDTFKDECYYYRIEGANIDPRSTEFTPLFSPNLIKKRILSYSLGWDIPFRVNYFLYLTSPEIVYVSVGSNDIFNELPEHLSLVEDDYSLINQNYYKVKFFSTTTSPESAVLDKSVSKLKDGDVSALYIDQGKKEITFFEKQGTSFVEVGVSSYLDDPTLIAAIYSESYYGYECNMKKSVQRLHKFSTILSDRVELIKNSDLLPLCEKSKSQYESAKGLLSELNDATKEYNVDKETFDKILSIRDELDKINTEINKKSCPTIY